MDRIKKEHIGNFLKKFKKIASEGRGIDLVSRRKNLDSLVSLGLTKRNCKDEILRLSVSDYCDGPKPDRDKPGEVWEFGKTIGSRAVYIKLKIAQAGTERIAKCLSFHVADYPLRFPFRDTIKKGGDEK